MPNSGQFIVPDGIGIQALCGEQGRQEQNWQHPYPGTAMRRDRS